MLTNFVQIPLVGFMANVLLVFVIALTIPSLGKTNRIVISSLLGAAVLILLLNKVPLSQWLEAFSRNGALAALFITIPMLNIPFGYGDYQHELQNFARRNLGSPFLFCLVVWILTHLFGLIILIGAIPFMFNLLEGNAKMYGAEKEFASTLVHAQVSAGFWSPIWSSMIIVTYTLGIAWLDFVPFGLLVTLIFFVFSMLWLYISLKRSGAHPIKASSDTTTSGSAMLTIVVLAILPVLVIVVVNYISDISITSAIPIVSLGYPVAVAMVMGKWRRYATGMSDYFNVRILNVKNEVALLTAAGFFGKALELAGIQSAVTYLLPSNLADFPFLGIISIMMVFVITVHFGMHPVIAGSAMVVSLAPQSLGLSQFMFGFVLITGWALGILLSPFSATNMVTGGLVGEPSWNISTKRHGIFGLSMLVLLSGVLALLSRYF
jgi:hypothetical protein